MKYKNVAVICDTLQLSLFSSVNVVCSHQPVLNSTTSALKTDWHLFASPSDLELALGINYYIQTCYYYNTIDNLIKCCQFGDLVTILFYLFLTEQASHDIFY